MQPSLKWQYNCRLLFIQYRRSHLHYTFLLQTEPSGQNINHGDLPYGWAPTYCTLQWIAAKIVWGVNFDWDCNQYFRVDYSTPRGHLPSKFTSNCVKFKTFGGQKWR